MAADLGLVSRSEAQEHVADRSPVDPGDQQHAPAGLLRGQAVGEEAALGPEDGHERLQVAGGGRPDLHCRPR
jgi:hypothetical protein